MGGGGGFVRPTYLSKKITWYYPNAMRQNRLKPFDSSKFKVMVKGWGGIVMYAL